MKTEARQLSDLCEEIVDCPHSTPMWTERGKVVLRSKNIRGGRLDLSETSYTDDEHFEQRSKRARLRAGDLVITREAPMGEVCMIPDGLECCLGQRMVMLRPDPGVVDGRFLLYALQSRVVQHQIGMSEGTGSTVSNLRIPLLKALEVPTPILREQRRIANVLGTLDDKIELNRRMSETLEEMARALFKSWFVDFDPVRAKAEGRDTGLPPHIADLFPDRLVDSNLGQIPAGWNAGHLHDVADLNARTMRAGDLPSEVEYVDLSGTKWGEIKESTSYGAASAPSRARRELREGDTVVGTVRPGNGSYALVSRDGYVGSTGFAVLSAQRPGDKWLVYLAATGSVQIERLAALADGGAYPAVRPSVVHELPTIVAPEPVRDAFSGIAGDLLERVALNRSENTALSEVCDALLRELIG